MKTLTKEKRDRLILIAIGTLLTIVGAWYGLISTQKKALVEIAKTITEQQNKVNNAQRLVSSTSQIQRNLEASTARLRAIEEGMASGDMYSWIINTVNNFKARHRVDIPQFSREVPGEVGLFVKFPYKAAIFNVRGTAYYHDLGKFIADFENTFPYLRVQNLEMEPAANSSATSTGDSEKLAFKMEIVALVNPQVR
jgi:Tfp pilus assembly protein PilO